MNPQDPYRSLQNPQQQQGSSSLPPLNPVPSQNSNQNLYAAPSSSAPQPIPELTPRSRAGYPQLQALQPRPQPAQQIPQPAQTSYRPQPLQTPYQSQPAQSLNPNPNPSASSNPAPFSNPAPNNFNSPAATPDDYTTVDYLNRIAPLEERTVNRFAVFGLIGAAIVSAIVLLVVMVSSQGPDANGQIPTISDRINTLSSVSKNETTKLTQLEISEANASLSSTLTSMKSQLDAIIKERKLKSSGSVKKEEKAYLEKLQKKLDDAHQKGTLDRTYTTAMTYELSILKSQVNKLKRSSGNNKSIAAFCNSSITSIDTILASYSKFSASKQ
ncbi:AI-2E family transporter [Candidatus Southlakia epibionticum]|uniref:Uncharacterized protein n=1 Tax=Candidatus Southlakia epibionticum TaxID=3043284 RepID=A0ABY8WTA3_9BACT|nr:hypothetical protein SEML1_0061 [Candidatus Saccharimonadaceae bacterium ML1]